MFSDALRFPVLRRYQLNEGITRRSGLRLHFARRNASSARWTKPQHFAIQAIRISSIAAASSMPNQQMAEQRPKLARSQFYQVLFNFDRVVFRGQTEPFGQAHHMRINYDPFIDVEGIAQNNIRRLATNSGK